MTAPFLQQPELTWGQLSFIDPEEIAENLYEIEAIAAGWNFGNPTPVVEVIRSLLIDGSLAARTGWDNREIPIRLRVTSNDGDSAAQAEAVLMQQCLMDQPYPLIYTPPLGGSATTVFDVVVANFDRDVSDGWDFDEIARGDRFYLLTLTCLPFGRAVESTVVPALPVPTAPEEPDETVVDDCTSATGWTRETNGGSPTGPTVVGGSSLQVTATVDSNSDHLRLVRTGSFSVPAGYYLTVDASTDGIADGALRARINGVWRTPVAAIYGAGENGSWRLFFEDVPATVTELAAERQFVSVPPSPQTMGLRVHRVATTDVVGDSTVTTNKQQTRLATVGGSAPTQAAVRVYAGEPLGTDILIGSSRNTDWQPMLRRWKVAGETASADPSAVTGVLHSLATPTKYRIPADLLTQGAYSLSARVSVGGGPITVTWQARMTTLAGAATVGSDVVTTGEIDLASTVGPDGFDVIDLAGLILPVVEVERGSGYALELTLTGTSGVGIDEVYLRNLDDSALTWVHDEEALEWIEIRSPELGATRPSVWGGKGDPGVGGSCIDWKCRSFGSHRFDPGVVQFDMVTTSTFEAQAELEFFPRFHSHAWSQETD